MTGTVLHIEASGTLDGSVSRAATAKLVADVGAGSVIYRDLAADVLPQIDAAWIAARLVPEAERSDAERAVLALSDTLVAEMQAADTIVIGMPMYNFGLPAALKAWVDLVCRPKLTFAYTPDGPIGLLEGKRAIVAVASGGVPVSSPMDFATPHLVKVLDFVGIKDVTVHTAKDLIATQAA